MHNTTTTSNDIQYMGDIIPYKRTSTSGVNNSIQHTLNNKRNQSRTKRSNGRKKNKRLRRKNVYNGTYLPEIDNRPIHTRCVRYTGELNERCVFTSQDLRCFAGFVTNTSTTYYPVADAIQLQRVGLTLLPNNSSSAGTVTFQWEGFNVPNIRETLLVANAIPFHMSFRPQEGMSAQWWWDNTSTTTNLFSVECTLQTAVIIVLDLEFKFLFATGAVTSVAITVAAGLTGLVYRQLPIGDLSFTPVDLDHVQ